MPTFKNVTGKDLWLDRPGGPGFLVGPTGTFEGSMYYRKYTDLEQTQRERILLELTAGDTGVYVPTYIREQTDVPNKFKTYSLTLTGDYADNRIDFREDSELGKEAFYLKISASGANMDVQLNDDVEFTITSGSTETFDPGSIVVVTAAFKGSGATAAVFAGTTIRPNYQ